MKKYILLLFGFLACHLAITHPITYAQTVSDATPEATPSVRVATQGMVSGVVRIGTTGLLLDPDAEISLHIVDPISQTEQVQTTVITSDNRYVFRDVTITEGNFYFVLMSVNEHKFASNPIAGDVRFPNLDLPITVYDVSTDPTIITIENIVVQIQPTQGVLGFTQVVQVRNRSDRLYVGGIPTINDLNATFELTLPVGALVTQTFLMLNDEIAATPPSSFVVDNSTFKVQYTEPIFPDWDYLFIIHYLMPYEQDAVMEFPVWHRFKGEMRLLISTDELQVFGKDIENLGMQTRGDAQFWAYRMSYDAFPNDIVRYELRGRVTGVGEFQNMRASSQYAISLSDNLPLLIIIGIISILIIFLGVTFISGRRKSKMLLIETHREDVS